MNCCFFLLFGSGPFWKVNYVKETMLKNSAKTKNNEGGKIDLEKYFRRRIKDQIVEGNRKCSNIHITCPSILTSFHQGARISNVSAEFVIDSLRMNVCNRYYTDGQTDKLKSNSMLNKNIFTL